MRKKPRASFPLPLTRNKRVSREAALPARAFPRFLPILLVLTAGFILSLALFGVLRMQAQADLRRVFAWESTLYTAALQQNHDHIIDQVDAAGRLFDSTPTVTRRSFKAFVSEPLRRHPEFSSLAWVPRVTGSQRASLESTARQDGISDFQITQRTANGGLASANARAEYFPLYYVEPGAGNESEMGFDLSSDQEQRQSLLNARDIGEMVTTQMVRTAPGQKDHAVFLIFRPVYRADRPVVTVEERRQNLEGFVLGVFDVSDFVKDALMTAKVEQVSVHIYEQDPSGRTNLVYEDEETHQRPTLLRSVLTWGIPVFSRLSETSILQLPGRTWRVVFEPKASFFGEHRTNQLWMIFAASFLVTLLVSLNMLRISRRNARISTLASQLFVKNQALQATILEHERAQSALRESEDKVRQMQKMEAIGLLAGGIAHDFNNILMVILGFSDLLLADARSDNPAREHVRTIKNAALRASDLTRQLLAFSRKQVLQPRVVDLNVLVRDGEKMLRRLIREDIELVFDLSGGAIHVRVDPGQVSQILMNLAANARDAMHRGGKLTIETRAADFTEGAPTGQNELQPGRYAMVAVSDTGVGMSDATKSHLFEPFFTTKEVGKGTGLGLASVYGIVKQSGGAIAVVSEPGTGTTFTMYLPLIETYAAADEAPSPESGGSLRGSETILLVEDEEELRTLVKVVLQENGYTVIEAENGKQALRACREKGSGIHAIVTDLVMPHMGGIEAVRRIRQFNPGLAVVLMTGYTEDFMALNETLEEGIVVLQKPFSTGTLLCQLRKSLDSTVRQREQQE